MTNPRVGTALTAACGLLALLAASGCIAKRPMAAGDVARAEAVQAKISEAESMNAKQCAPRELARAHGALDHFRREAVEVAVGQDALYVGGYFGRADAAADELLAKTRPCWEARQDDDGDSVANRDDRCPGTPAGVAVDDAGCALDSDNDGVADHQDACPSTASGVRVDARGCPLDADGDGVADAQDRCPDTPAGVAVDGRGCPLDSDRDGVADHLDRCPNTPSGAQVDARGCAQDADGDGVADHLDACPDTPAGAVVDGRGCPVDSDGDGVADYRDQCAGTPRGAPVDAVGCPLDSDGDGLTDWDETQTYGTDPNKADTDEDGLSDGDEVLRHRTDPIRWDTDGGGVGDGVEVNVAKTDPHNRLDDRQEVQRAELRVLFATNSAQVSDRYLDDLQKLGEFLRRYRRVNAVIEGHTDSVGAAAYNQDLSQRRAQAVVDLLVERWGIDASRLTAKGYGESQPIASNDTPEGRTKNRRIYVEVTTE